MEPLGLDCSTRLIMEINFVDEKFLLVLHFNDTLKPIVVAKAIFLWTFLAYSFFISLNENLSLVPQSFLENFFLFLEKSATIIENVNLVSSSWALF